VAKTQAYAIFVIDPGETTGCTKAVVDVGQPNVAASLRRAYVKGLLETSEYRGSYVEQSQLIVEDALDFFYFATFQKAWVPQRNWNYIYEGFNPNRQMHKEFISMEINAGVRTLFSTGDRANWLASDVDAVLRQQDPSNKTFVNDRMLKKWGWAWKGRSDHERDTIRHLGYRVDELMRNGA
jgi:hypothetical protein